LLLASEQGRQDILRRLRPGGDGGCGFVEEWKLGGQLFILLPLWTFFTLLPVRIWLLPVKLPLGRALRTSA
jgi:hypothetical protein